MSRNIARHVPEDEKSRFLTEATDVIAARKREQRPQYRLKPVCDYLVDNQLRLLVSDKEGFFVVVPNGIFSEKASAAIAKSFKKVKAKPSSYRKKAIAWLDDHNLRSLSSRVKAASEAHLDVFFTAKTHKVDIPFRTIVSERRTWQYEISGFLQRHLKTLKVQDPFLIPSSSTVIQFLMDKNPGTCSAMSIDVEDLYYSLPQDRLLRCVQDCITVDNDEQDFIDACGVSVASFMELLSFYLNSTFVCWQDSMYVQRSGVCIGSQVAPLLSDIFLSKVDTALQPGLEAIGVVAFRYVDDYLIFLGKDDSDRLAQDVLGMFKEGGQGLSFTSEFPKDNHLQFLDLDLCFGDDHVCWGYSPRSGKPLLSYQSDHSRLVKDGLAVACIKSALRKSCHHRVEDSFSQQVSKLMAAGFPTAHLARLSERVLTRLRKSNTGPEDADVEVRRKKVAAFPYLHGVSHRLKKLAAKYDVGVVFTAKNKIGGLCASVKRRLDKTSSDRSRCTVSHKTRLTPCRKNVVYRVPLPCGRCYYGQTGRCLNVRLTEHSNSLGGKANSNLALHVQSRECKSDDDLSLCTPDFSDTTVVYRNEKQICREIVEAFYIAKAKDTCVAKPSVNLHAKEFAFLDNLLVRP